MKKHYLIAVIWVGMASLSLQGAETALISQLTKAVDTVKTFFSSKEGKITLAVTGGTIGGGMLGLYIWLCTRSALEGGAATKKAAATAKQSLKEPQSLSSSQESTASIESDIKSDTESVDFNEEASSTESEKETGRGAFYRPEGSKNYTATVKISPEALVEVLKEEDDQLVTWEEDARPKTDSLRLQPTPLPAKEFLGKKVIHCFKGPCLTELQQFLEERKVPTVWKQVQTQADDDILWIHFTGVRDTNVQEALCVRLKTWEGWKTQYKKLKVGFRG